MLQIIRKGDKTTHSGSVMTASETMKFGGIGVARKGDKVSCPIPGHGPTAIIEGIRVVTWYIQARLSLDGEKGLAEGVLLLVAMLSRYGKRCHPLRANARQAALEWLNSSKMLDTLSRWPEVDRDDAGLTAGAVSLLSASVADWPEDEKPSFTGLCTTLDNRLARSGGVGVLIPQNSSIQETGRDTVLSPSPQLTAVKSGRDLLDQARLLSDWLGEQPQGWLASHRLIKTIRWDTVDQIPPLDSAGRTRLLPPTASAAAYAGITSPPSGW